jgi:hypothetical protein
MLFMENSLSKVDLETFFRNGLNLSDDEAKRLAPIHLKTCALLGAAGGVALATLAIKDLKKPMQPAPSKSMTLVMLLLGLGVGFVSIGGACVVIKLKIDKFLESQYDTASAIGSLTPELRQELQDEARRLLKLEQNILDMNQDNNELPPNMA